jgi:hypothetical protein
MPTTFPSEIKIKNIVKFKGDPQQLSTLDISIYDLCNGNNYPAYYGGTVTGCISTEYVYCTSATVGSADNYIFGRRFCSKIVSEFQGDAKLWWEDYIQGGGKRPNCWKSAVLNEVEGSKPDRIVELSLFDLLSAEFLAENDQQAADVELKRYRWNPLEKDAKPFATFKSHTKSLAKRAGYSNWALQAQEIRNCIEPKSLKLSVPLHNRESDFWSTMQVQVNTALADYIDDVKHVIEPIDDTSVVAPSRPALYTPRNDVIIHAKCDPLVEMGVYTLAGPDSYNRSQLVIAKRPIPPEVSRKRDTDLPQDVVTEDELKYYRVAHDLRGLNAKCRLRPWPMTTLSEMSLWIANRSVFFSVDADRGFQQIVNDPGSVKFTSFEMFHQLFVSLRMQFGDLNAPGTFAQNCDAVLGDLKFKDKKVKNYFDDIIGGASQMDFWGLRQTKRALLERCRDHGWKLKPRKEQIGFTDMEMIGLVGQEP